MTRGTWAMVAGIAVIAAVGSAVASASPDGLERVAADLGFERRATTVYSAPMPDYEVAAAGPLSGPVAGLVGAGLVGGLAFGAGRLVRRPR